MLANWLKAVWFGIHVLLYSPLGKNNSDNVHVLCAVQERQTIHMAQYFAREDQSTTSPCSKMCNECGYQAKRELITGEKPHAMQRKWKNFNHAMCRVFVPSFASTGNNGNSIHLQEVHNLVTLECKRKCTGWTLCSPRDPSRDISSLVSFHWTNLPSPDVSVMLNIILLWV